MGQRARIHLSGLTGPQAQAHVGGAQEGAGAGNGVVGDGDGEGWQFWPPAEQSSDGAYQRPS